MGPSMTSAISESSAPRQTEMACRVSEHSDSSSSVRTTTSTWPLIRRARFNNLFFSSMVCAIRDVYPSIPPGVYSRGKIVPVIAEQFEFGPFLLDTSNSELRRDGAPIKLRPQAFSVLCALVQSTGQWVSCERLISDAWEGHYVSRH